MHLYFIRHGQSENNALYKQSGSWVGRSHDPELTAIGRQQAEYLARFLASETAVRADDWDPQNTCGFGITHVYSSLMCRAAATGSIVAECLGLPLTAWEHIHEGGGIYLDDAETEDKVGQPGPNRAELASRFPRLQLPATLGAEGWWNRPYEEPEHRPARARRFLDELLSRHGGSEHHVAIISHGGFYNLFLGSLLSLPAQDGKWFELNNAAITRIDFNDWGVALVYMNRVDFLPKDLIT